MRVLGGAVALLLAHRMFGNSISSKQQTVSGNALVASEQSVC
jgi:hypothetical protein